MLMKEELAQLVIEGKKRQTRRPIKAGEALVTIDGVKTVMAGNGKRIKYQVGREYSIQYGRGLPTRVWCPEECKLLPIADAKHYWANTGSVTDAPPYVISPLRIKLLDVWAEDVRRITRPEAEAEGFSCADEFLVTWAEFYDAKLNAKWMTHEGVGFVLWNDTQSNGSYVSRDIEGLRIRVADFPHWLKTRHPDLYLGWALEFEVVR